MNTAKLDDEIQRLGYPTDENDFQSRVLGCCETPDEREALEELGLGEWMETYLPSRTLVAVGWEAWGSPMGGGDSIELLTLGEHAYFFVPRDYAMDTHDLLFLGTTSAPPSPKDVSELVRDQLQGLITGTTTTSRGSDIWPERLPTETENCAPDLVTRDAIREAYLRVLAAGRTLPWGDIWDSLLGDVWQLLGEDWLRQWIGKRDIAEFAASDAPEDLLARNEIFEGWFSHTYREPEVRG